MAFCLPYLLTSASILGIIWLSHKACQTRYSLKGSEIRFERFLLVRVIFALSTVLSDLFGILEGDKRVPRSILLGDITQKYEAVHNKKEKEQALAQKMGEFTACYEDMNSIFANQEGRLTGKNMKELTRLYQNLSEKQQKEVQERYEQVEKDVQHFKGTQTEKAYRNLSSDIIPFSTSEQKWEERQQSVIYGCYETLLQQATNIQNPTEKETTLSYLESAEEWLDRQQQDWIWLTTMLDWTCKWSNIRYMKAPKRLDSLGLPFGLMSPLLILPLVSVIQPVTE